MSAMSIVHCKKEPYDIYIGRGHCPRTGEPGRWGNPFRVGPDGDRKEVIARYAAWLRDEVDAEHVTLEELAALDGKVLGCRSALEACHGEILERAADWAARMIAGGPNMYWDLRPSKRGGHMEPLIRR
jgi:hypothetical protein